MTPVELEQLAGRTAELVLARLTPIMAMQPANSDAYLDVHEVAGLLSCSVPTVERLTRSGNLKSVKVGRLRRYRRSDVLACESHGGR
jgi:excisionase family DNA binding protein